MVYKFTNRAEKVIEFAKDVAAEIGHNYVGTEHLLCGLLREGSGLAYRVLDNQGITEGKVEELIEELIQVFDYGPEWIYDNFVRRNL